jgi:hypothetical protein
MDKASELKMQISDYLLESLMKEDFRQSLCLFLNIELKNIIIDRKKDILKGKAYKNIEGKIKNWLLLAIKSPVFKNQIYSFIDDNLSAFEKSNKTLDKTIPATVINSLKVYIYNHKDELISALKKLLSSKDIEKRMLSEINNVINGMNPMVARFVNVNNIFSRLKISIDDYLNDSKNILEIINFINSQLDNIMKKRISEFSAYFPIEGKRAIIDSLTHSLLENLSKPKFIEMIFSVFEEKLTVELTNLNINSSNLNTAISSLTSSFINTTYETLLINGGIKELITSISEGIVDNFLSKPLIDLI